MKTSDFFNVEEKRAISEAIRKAELKTSGEIRVHIESQCKIEALDRAAFIFSKLKMHKTKERNGVLFYIAIVDKKFAIIGDAGINTKVPANFWDEIRSTMFHYFIEKKYVEGLEKGIHMTGEQLKSHFPHQIDDVNELSNEVSFGK